MLVSLIAAAAVLVLVAVVVVLFNRLQRDRQLVREAWAQIDVMLARRHRLITDLTVVTAAAADYERTSTVTAVEARRAELDAARGAAEAAPGPERRGRAEEALDRRVGEVVALVESYPDLRADQAFATLRRELVQSEEDVAAARRYYNGRVRRYQDRIGTFPSNLVAGALRFAPAEYFQVERDAREAPNVG